MSGAGWRSSPVSSCALSAPSADGSSCTLVKLLTRLLPNNFGSGRHSLNARMLSTVGKQLRNHPALIPLFVFIGGGATMSMMYLARLGLRNPDVCWDRKNNPEPWNKMSPTDQYKFYTVNMDYSKLKKNGPDF